MTLRQQAARCGLVLLVVSLTLASADRAGVSAEPANQLVLEDFKHADTEGFPVNWEHESARSGANARRAYQVQSEQSLSLLAVKGADQRIKKKKIDWDPKAYPILSWRWRLKTAPTGADPIAVVYVSLDTDLLFIPVFTKYVWSVAKPEGAVIEGGIFSGTEIVIRSGPNPIGEWVQERVNVYEDFTRIHKHEPAERAWGISLLGGPGVEIDFGPLIAVPSS